MKDLYAWKTKKVEHQFFSDERLYVRPTDPLTHGDGYEHEHVHVFLYIIMYTNMYVNGHVR